MRNELSLDTLTVTSTIEAAIASSAAPALAAGLPGRSNSARRNPGSFAAMCASKLSTQQETGTKPSSPTMTVDGMQKPDSKATLVNPLGTKNSGRNSPPVASDRGLTSLLPGVVLVPVPLPPAPVTTLYLAPAESSAGSSPATGVNNDNSSANQSGQPVQATSSGLSAPLPATKPSLNTALNATAGESAMSLAWPTQQPKTQSPQAPSTTPTLPAGISSNVVSFQQSAENSIAAPQNPSQSAPFTALPTIVSVPDCTTAPQVSVTSPSGVPVPSAISVIANVVSIASQGPPASESTSSSSQSNRSSEAQASLNAAGIQSSTKTTPGNLQHGNVLPTILLSLPVPRTDLKQPAAQTSPGTPSAATKQNSQTVQSPLNALRTLGTSAVSRISDQLSATQPHPDNPVPATQSANPFPGFSVIAPIPAFEANPLGTTANTGKSGLAAADSALPSPLTLQAETTKAAAHNSQSGTSGGDIPDPSPQKGSAVVLAASGDLQATSFQSAVAVMDPTRQATIPGTTGQPAVTTGPVRKSDSAGPASSGDSPANLPASGDLPLNPTGPVQMAQMVSKAAQSEMRIGLNTSAFGNVEVRTVVHANEVGVVIGSEKGDLRSLLSNELPGIANTLQRQDLRLNQVHFHQSELAFSNQMSSGSDSQARAFASKPTTSMALTGPMPGVESHESPESLSTAHGSGLSILA